MDEVILVLQDDCKVAKNEVQIFLIEELKQVPEMGFFEYCPAKVKRLMLECVVFVVNGCTLHIVALSTVLYHERYAVCEQGVEGRKGLEIGSGLGNFLFVEKGESIFTLLN